VDQGLELFPVDIAICKYVRPALCKRRIGA